MKTGLRLLFKIAKHDMRCNVDERQLRAAGYALPERPF